MPFSRLLFVLNLHGLPGFEVMLLIHYAVWQLPVLTYLLESQIVNLRNRKLVFWLHGFTICVPPFYHEMPFLPFLKSCVFATKFCFMCIVGKKYVVKSSPSILNDKKMVKLAKIWLLPIILRELVSSLNYLINSVLL